MARAHGGRLVAKALARHGVTHLFTLCGGHIQAIYDGCLDEGIGVVDVRHEQTAGHAADGYARMTGTPGVCAVTAGPGVTDVVTAVANAQRAGVPMLVLGGAGPLLRRDMGSLQDMNHVELMAPITKWATSVPSTERLQEYLEAAFRIASAGVPGPVFLELPIDLLMGFADDAPPPTAEAIAPPMSAGDPAAVERAAALIARAERPMFIVGSQIRFSRAREAIGELADGLGAPFFLSGMARGALPRAHPGLMTRARRFALARADAVVILGTPLDFRLDYGAAIDQGASLVAVDLDAATLGKNRSLTAGIAGDSGLVARQLAQAIGERSWPDWLATVRSAEEASRAKMATYMKSDSDPPGPLRVCAEIAKRLGPEDIVIGDGGDFVATAAYVLQMQWPQVWMDPGPLGTLGMGPGYAMAAKLTRPDARVWVVYGDGSFGLHAMELEAMARQGIEVLAVIGNDAAWTQIRRGQVQLYGTERAVATKLDYTRYDQVAVALGCFGAHVRHTAELGAALDAAMQAGAVACVNVEIGPSDFRNNAISV